MCGIVGFYANQRSFEAFRADLPAAVSCVRHRGPDDEGIWTDAESGFGLGHRRLSILDLSSAGHQPMSARSGSIQIVFNGEIYNFRAIREELVSRGHSFISETDTEVILNAYAEWGIEAVKRFVGMFAMALWDARIGRLFLVRDRLGIKPLYYYLKDGCLLFGSELKALMAFRHFPRDVDDDSLALYLHYQYVPALRTIFRNCFKLPPAHYLAYNGESAHLHRYWDFPETGTSHADEAAHLDRLQALIRTSVRDRLISDVPLGALLSGGIDSSLVVSVMREVAVGPVRTFSIGFHESGYNEAEWASAIARTLGTDHTELYVAPDEAMRLIPDLPEIYDEPFADSSAIPTCLVSRLVRSRVTVALSGDGGDEQFAGYVRYWMTPMLHRRLAGLPPVFRRFLHRLFGAVSAEWIASLYLPWRHCLPARFQVANVQDKWQKLVRLLEAEGLADIYRTAVGVFSASEVNVLVGRRPIGGTFEAVLTQGAERSAMARLMRTDQHTYLPDAMLTKVDRASMAAGLEVRVPLLDHRLVEYAAGIPEDLLYRNGSGKYLLKKLLGRYLPERLFERPKMGFGVPLADWLRGPLREILLDYLSDVRLKQEKRFDTAMVAGMIHDHLTGRRHHPHRLWALLMWEMWRERWLGDG